jgi:hypothetical protein
LHSFAIVIQSMLMISICSSGDGVAKSPTYYVSEIFQDLDIHYV